MAQRTTYQKKMRILIKQRKNYLESLENEELIDTQKLKLIDEVSRLGVLINNISKEPIKMLSVTYPDYEIEMVMF